MNSNIVIVTRHKGMIEWLARRGITGVVIDHVSSPDQIKDKNVYGILPLHLACLCDVVWTVDLPKIKPEDRGKDISADEMDQAGAKLSAYVVDRLELDDD